MGVSIFEILVQQQQKGGQLVTSTAGTSQYATYHVWVDWTSTPYSMQAGLSEDLTTTSGYGVKSVRIRRGRDDALSSMQAGTATIVLHDPDGRYNPENAASPLYGSLLPLKNVFIQAYNGSSPTLTGIPGFSGQGWPLFFGNIRSIEHDPSRDMQETTIEVGGRLLYLSRVRINPTVAPDAFTVGAALKKPIVWQTGQVIPGVDSIDIADGLTLPSDWAAAGDDGVTEAENLLIADRGCFYEKADGGFAYEPRADRTAKASSATIADTMLKLGAGVDLDRVANRATVTRTGGEAQTADNLTSQAAYGVVEMGSIESPALASDADALTLAQYLVDQFGTPRSPMWRLSLMNRDITTMDQILQRDLQDRITVTDSRGGTSGDYYIEAIEHEITDGGKFHRCNWTLSARGSGTATGHAGVLPTATTTAAPEPTISYLESTSVAFPSNPKDRDEVYVVADDTNGVVWHFRYRAGSGSSYKWEFVGGSSLSSEVTTQQTRTSSTYGALTTAGPSITVPFAGDYAVSIGCLAQAQGGAGNASAVMSYDIGGTGAVDADSVDVYGKDPTEAAIARTRTKTISAAATTLTAKYKLGTGAGTAYFANRWMRVVPVRVAG